MGPSRCGSGHCRGSAGRRLGGRTCGSFPSRPESRCPGPSAAFTTAPAGGPRAQLEAPPARSQAQPPPARAASATGSGMASGPPASNTRGIRVKERGRCASASLAARLASASAGCASSASPGPPNLRLRSRGIAGHGVAACIVTRTYTGVRRSLLYMDLSGRVAANIERKELLNHAASGSWGYVQYVQSSPTT
jgi:hypothetical protein